MSSGVFYVWYTDLPFIMLINGNSKEVCFMFRFVLLVFWMALIFLFTCAFSLEDFVLSGMISFQVTLNPHFTEFLYPLPERPPIWFVLRKVGHAFVFLIMAILFYYNFQSKRMMVIISFFYAGLTEILQLFFQRGGRLFDIIFDGIGIILAFVVITIISAIKSELIRKLNI
jgi:VanZ family protein